VKSPFQVACIYGVQAGLGGLGVQSANAIASLATGGSPVHAFGPGHNLVWPVSHSRPNINWCNAPIFIPNWATRYTWLRWYQGELQFRQDTRLGRWAANQIKQVNAQHGYTFTQVGREMLTWARSAGIPTTLDSPNGNIRNCREVYERESQRWCGKVFRGHPSPAMVERVEEEYQLAGMIRVSSEWAKNSLITGGVAAKKIRVFQQPVDLLRFIPFGHRKESNGPLRVCFVGSLDFRKGFLYLLRAVKLLGSDHINLEVVGATGNRHCARLLSDERKGVNLYCAPGNPVPAYHRAELFVFPTLEDGFGFAVAEAMACGLPVIVTNNCGAAEWVKSGRTGWIVPSGKVEPLAQALEEALHHRQELQSMGQLARADVEQRAGSNCFTALSHWIHETKYA
jgi:glycosyltransferase involved in cell wall biosynthesis